MTSQHKDPQAAAVVTEDELQALEEREKRYLEHVGDVLRRKRRSMGLTQAELGERVGRTKVWVSDVERGRNDSHTSAFRYASALGLDMSYVTAMAALLLNGEDRLGDGLQTA